MHGISYSGIMLFKKKTRTNDAIMYMKCFKYKPSIVTNSSSIYNYEPYHKTVRFELQLLIKSYKLKNVSAFLNHYFCANNNLSRPN
jgi:hypothetical protein